MQQSGIKQGHVKKWQLEKLIIVSVGHNDLFIMHTTG